VHVGQAQELFSLLGKKLRITPKYWLGQCPSPNHEDKNPSCRINPSHPHSFKWFSCGYSGTLYSIAKEHGMEIDNKVDLMADNSRQIKLPNLDKLRLEHWTGDYRGIDEATWRNFGALRWYDTRVDDQGVEQLSAVRLFLPIYLKSVMVGYVGRRTDDSDFMRYNNYGDARFSDLLYLIDGIQPTFPIVLVEGPLDAIRYQMNQIPAVSILGAMNWSENKLKLLLEKNPSTVWLSMDGDGAGQKAQQELYNKLSRYFDVQLIQLPTGVDPFDLTQELIEQVRDSVWQRHYSKQPVPNG